MGIISNPVGACSEDLILPIIAIEECAFSVDSFSRSSSGQSPFLATIGISRSYL